MSGLKQVKHYGVGQQGSQRGIEVTPDEMDMYRQYVILNPSVTDTYFGTVSSASAAAFVFDQTRADYPRSLLFVALGVAGGMGGTAVINGKNQFGEVIQETLSFGSAAGGGTIAGTKVFAQVTSGTFTPVGLGGTAVGTAKLGVAIGTSSTQPLFGLPDRIGGTNDVKNVQWLDADVSKNHGAANKANVANSAVLLDVAGGIAAADSFVILYKPTKDLSAQGYQTGL